MATSGKSPCSQSATSCPSLDAFCQREIFETQSERKAFGQKRLTCTRQGCRRSRVTKQLLAFPPLPGDDWPFARDKCNLHILLRSPAKHDQHICNETTLRFARRPHYISTEVITVFRHPSRKTWRNSQVYLMKLNFVADGCFYLSDF